MLKSNSEKKVTIDSDQFEILSKCPVDAPVKGKQFITRLQGCLVIHHPSHSPTFTLSNLTVIVSASIRRIPSLTNLSLCDTVTLINLCAPVLSQLTNIYL